MPSAEEILENFREFQPTVVYKNRDFAFKFKTRQGGYSCTVVVNFVAHFIYYHASDKDYLLYEHPK